jgi:hypothetical protein
MEGLGQLGRLYDNLGSEMQKRHALPCKRVLDPSHDIAVELQPSILYQFGDFPTRDDANAEHAISAEFEKISVPRAPADLAVPISVGGVSREKSDPSAVAGVSHCNPSRCVRNRVSRRQTSPDQNVGAQVRAVGPNYSAAFDTYLPKSRLVVPDLGKNRTYQIWPEISLDHPTVGQCESNPIAVQRLHFPDAN